MIFYDLEFDDTRAELTLNGVDSMDGVEHRKCSQTIGTRHGDDSFVVLHPDRRFVGLACARPGRKLPK
jgi:hypothetical protein